MKFLATMLALAASVLQVACQTAPPYSPSPFQITGTIGGMTQTAKTPLTGGTITVDGIVITIPKNLLATLPSITVSWDELFVNGAAQLPGSQKWQATILGNRVGNSYIAGLVYIAQSENRQLQGFIEKINTTGSGELTINGRKMLLNDPLGRFGPKYTANPLWSVDPENVSVRSSTGFPMCVPRSSTDAKCPSKNRPSTNGKPVQKYTFKDPAKLTATDPDPRVMMPLAVGDYVTYSGVDLGDVFAIYSLDANLGIYTASGTKPAYVTVEEAQYAVVQGVETANGEDGETRAVVFSTDASTTITMYAMDQDPCTGAFTKRTLQTAQVDGDAPAGRAKFRSRDADWSPATRYIGFDASQGTGGGPDGVSAGTFVQPIFEYIVPELTVFGDPEITIDFSKLVYLAKGSGPYAPGNPLTAKPSSPPRVGQLDPWPGASKPAAASCTASTSSNSSPQSAAQVEQQSQPQQSEAVSRRRVFRA